MSNLTITSSVENAIELRGICKTYDTAACKIAVLNQVNLSIRTGESCAIIGKSGSGKSTLLNIIGLLDTPSSGKIFLSAQDVSCLKRDESSIIRNRSIGFIFQSFNLLPRLTALDNVALPLLYRGYTRRKAREKAFIQLESVNLSAFIHRIPADLSGGQRQRVAIARALIGEPSLILADEPTGSLDPETGRSVEQLLLNLTRRHRRTLIVVTHDLQLASKMDRSLVIEEGGVREVKRLHDQ